MDYETEAPVDGDSLEALLRTRPHRTVFKFRGADFREMGLGDLGQKLEADAKSKGGSAAMEILREKSQMSTLFAPAGAGDSTWDGAFEHTTNKVDFKSFARAAAAADAALLDDDVPELDRRVSAGARSQKVTEWKPEFLRRPGGLTGVPARGVEFLSGVGRRDDTPVTFAASRAPPVPAP